MDIRTVFSFVLYAIIIFSLCYIVLALVGLKPPNMFTFQLTSIEFHSEENKRSPSISPLIGVIWPQQNSNESERDRIMEQILFIKKFWSSRNDTAEVERKPKVIYTPKQPGSFFTHKSLTDGPMDMFSDEGCPVNSCVMTTDEKLKSTADALVLNFYFKEYLDRCFPKPARQIWIAMHWEPPTHRFVESDRLNGLINWTLTYRRDSTIPFGYGYIKKIEGAPKQDNPVNYAQGKTKKAAIWVSNCEPRRMNYLRELSKHIKVDIYGYCGGMRCLRTDPVCTRNIEKQYKFYFAFENANCKDYITEKLFYNGLQLNMLPVVFGTSRAEYEAIAPANSFIHTDDFATTYDLAQYLDRVDKNDTLYNSYFEWKNTMQSFTITPTLASITPAWHQHFWCRVCTMLYLAEQDNYVHWYDDYKSWWNEACILGPYKPPRRDLTNRLS